VLACFAAIDGPRDAKRVAARVAGRHRPSSTAHRTLTVDIVENDAARLPGLNKSRYAVQLLAVEAGDEQPAWVHRLVGR